MNLKFWKNRRPVIARLIDRDPLKIRLQEFRGNKSLVGEAQKILSLSSLRLMLDCARNEHPANLVLPIGTSPNDRIVQQARGEGYTLALANLEAMGNYQELKDLGEATYETEETEK